MNDSITDDRRAKLIERIDDLRNERTRKVARLRFNKKHRQAKSVELAYERKIGDLLNRLTLIENESTQ